MTIQINELERDISDISDRELGCIVGSGSEGFTHTYVNPPIGSNIQSMSYVPVASSPVGVQFKVTFDRATYPKFVDPSIPNINISGNTNERYAANYNGNNNALPIYSQVNFGVR